MHDAMMIHHKNCDFNIDLKFNIVLHSFVGLLCLMPLSTIFRLYPGIVEVSFIGGGNRSTLRKPPTCCKS